MTPLPIHPEPVQGEPRALHWLATTGLPAGEVVKAPGTLGPLIEYGILTRVLAEPEGLWTWLAEGYSWVEHGPRIRDAVAAALQLDGWGVQEGSDQLLRLITAHVLEFELGPYIASHGGMITLNSVAEGRVVLDFGGTCGDCPAAGFTLHLRIEKALRRRYPALVDVSKAEPGSRRRRVRAR